MSHLLSGPCRTDVSLQPRREIAVTRAAIAFTLLMAALFGAQLLADAAETASARTLGELAVFGGIVAFLLYGNLVYQATRLGHFQRVAAHRPAARTELDAVYLEASPPPVAILVPSYKEELRLVRQTLLSAALQEHPDRRVVLLIDDPPAPHDVEDRAALDAARRLPGQLEALLAEPAGRLAGEQARFQAATAAGDLDPAAHTRHVASLYRFAADWIDALAVAEAPADHTDRFFVDRVLRAAADDHRRTAAALAAAPPLDVVALSREHARLAALFAVRMTSFERKRFANLPHEPNKAMNLNAYIGLLGGAYRTELAGEGLVLRPAGSAEAELHVPDAEFLVTLDADSLLLPGYVLRLLHDMRRPGGERIAVAQTPYSAVPGAAGDLERVAGATTDMMHIVHQGSTRWDATFWVGANAVLRTAALRDIAEHDTERGHAVVRFIQDRTVIEDTESTIDLTARGWRLANYPDRLAYSATPPDYGALLIQRRRWANGGLIILPKLVRAALRGSGRIRRLPENLLRLHYLTSITGVNVGVLVLLTYPFSHLDVPLWLPLSAVPYFWLYGRDLRQHGYRRGDLVRVYALNLLLVPVNLGGVLKSVEQAITRRKIPFGRTPKVADRTPAPALYVVATWLLLGHWAVGSLADATSGRGWLAIFGAANVALLAYATTRFMGWRAGLSDVQARWREVAPRRARAAVPPAEPSPTADRPAALPLVAEEHAA